MDTSADHPILKDDFASQWMGVRVVRADFGHAVLEMTLREEMLNGFGIAHGGMVFAFADSAFALACNDPAGDGSTVTVASGADIDFLRPARRGQVLTATARVRHHGRSGLYDITVTARDASDDPGVNGVVVAEFRGRSRTIPAPPAPPSSGAASSAGSTPAPAPTTVTASDAAASPVPSTASKGPRP